MDGQEQSSAHWRDARADVVPRIPVRPGRRPASLADRNCSRRLTASRGGRTCGGGCSTMDTGTTTRRARSIPRCGWDRCLCGCRRSPQGMCQGRPTSSSFHSPAARAACAIHALWHRTAHHDHVGTRGTFPRRPSPSKRYRRCCHGFARLSPSSVTCAHAWGATSHLSASRFCLI